MPAAASGHLPSDETQLRLSDYLRPIVDRWLLIIAAVVLVGTGTYVYYDRQAEVYTTTTSIFLTPASSTSLLQAVQGIDDRTTLSQATLLRTRGVAIRVAQRLGYAGSPDALLGAIDATPVTGSNFVTVSATWGTGQGAADIANAFAQEFIRVQSDQSRRDSERLLDRLRGQLRTFPRDQANAANRAELTAQVRQLEVSLQLPAGGARQVDSAATPGGPISPQPRRNTIFAGLLALLAGVAAAYGLDRFDRRIRRAEDAPDAYGLPLLSVIPHVSSFGPGGTAPAAFVEAFRLLQTNLRLAQVDRPLNIVLVTSAIPGEGKSTVVRYLAEAFSEWGKTVAVIDGDLRRPSLTRLYGITGYQGLTDLVSGGDLNGEVSGALVDVERPRIGGSGADAGGTMSVTPTESGDGDTEAEQGSVGTMTVARDHAAQPGSELAQIRVLPAGTAPPNPAALLAAGRTQQLVQRIAADHDLVIIDTPPVLAVSDAMALVPIADAVVLVSRVSKTTRDEAERLVDTLRRIPDAQLMGVVANDEVAADGDRYGYYT